MKNFRYLSLILFLFLVSFETYPSHIMGGEITWKCVGNGQYKFFFSLYRDCGGASSQNPTGQFFIHNYPNVGNRTSAIPVSYVNGNNQGNDLSPACYNGGASFNCASNDPRAVNEYLLETQPITLLGVPPPQGWIITYDDYARNINDNLLNASTRGITLRAKILNHSGTVPDKCIDNSPVFREKPTSLVCTGAPFTYNHNANDEELDSLVYEWAHPLDHITGIFVEGSNPPAIPYQSGYAYNNPFPSPGNTNPNNVAATLDPHTGEISLTSYDDGKFVSVIKVTAYKCGEPAAEIYRELQSVFTNTCQAGNTKPVITPPFPLTGTPTTFSDTFQAGDFISFGIVAIDTGQVFNPNGILQNVELQVSGLQLGANYTNPSVGCPNPPCATLTPAPPNTNPMATQMMFNWQTACNHVAYNDGCVSLSNTYTFVVRASDNSCPVPAQNIATIAITILADSVVPSPNLQCVNVKANGDVDLNWDLPPDPNNSFTAWMIYSGTSANGPFTIVDSVKNYNTTSYTHVGANAQNQQRWYYIRSRSGCGGGVLNVAQDTVPTMFVTSSLGANCWNVSWNPLGVPNPTGSSSQYAVYREYPIGSGMVFYQNTTATSICDVFTSCLDSARYRVELANLTAGCVSSSNIHQANVINPDPVANFTHTNPCTQPVQFTDNSTISTGTITSWNWDFGDGHTSSQQNPSHYYASAGNYLVKLTVQTALGCTDETTVLLSSSVPPADAGPDRSICPGASVQIGTSAVAGLSYSWTSIPNNNTISNPSLAEPIVNPGVTTKYYVQVTDVNGCSNIDSMEVEVVTPFADAGLDASVCENNSIVLGGSPTGPFGANYTWDNSSGTISNPNSPNPTATPLVTTTYSVTVSMGPGCTATDDITITVFPEPSVDAGADRNICPGESTTIGNSSNPNGTYLWSPGGMSSKNPTVSPNNTTTYTLTYTDANGCIATDDVVVTVNPLPTVDAGADRGICEGSSATIGGSPTGPAGSTFLWTNNINSNTFTTANPTVTPILTTVYTVEVTDANGCVATDDITITVTPIPIADAGPDQSICSGASATIGGSPTASSGSISWTELGNPTVISTSANPTVSPTTTTSYVVELSDGPGCIATDTVLVNVNPLPTVDAGADQSICEGTSVSIGGSPTAPTGSSYLWTNNINSTTFTTANPTVSPSVTTTYTVTATDVNGCANTDQVTVIVTPIPLVDAGADQDICIGSSTTIGGSPTASSGSISWTELGSPTVISTLANPTVSPTTTTSYVVEVTDGPSCIATDTVVVNVNPLPTVDAGTDQHICIGSSVTIGGSPTGPSGSSYLWTNNINSNTSTMANPTVSPTVSTTYTVSVTDANGCIATDDVVVTVNPFPTVDAGADRGICEGSSATIGGSPTGPAGSTFLWTNNINSNTFTTANPTVNPILTTIYTVEVTDANGCVATDDITITVTPIPIADAGSDQSICSGASATIGGSPTASSGSISWTELGNPTVISTSANPTVSPTTTTSYVVEVSDGPGCIATDTVLVNVNPLPTADAGADQAICEGSSATVGGSPTGPPGSTYLWTNNVDTTTDTIANPHVSPIVTTAYAVAVTDTNGCVSTDTVVVRVTAIPVADAGPDQTICVGGSIAIGGNPTASAGSISWTELGNPTVISTLSNPTVNPTTTTSYVMEVTDGPGCSSTDTVVVYVTPLPTVDAGADQAICEGSSATIGGSPTGPPGSTYLWTNNVDATTDTIANPHVSPTVTTAYTVAVTDTNGCVSTDTVVVRVDPLPTVDAGADQAICEGSSATIGGSPTGPPGSTYLWTNNVDATTDTIANPHVSPIVTTAYAVAVTDTNGCVSTDAVVVRVNPLPMVDAGQDITICLLDTVLIGGSPTGPTGATYSWTPTISLLDANVANPKAFPSVDTKYKVTVTDVNGCVNIDSMFVTVNPLPEVDAGPDQIMCELDSVELGGKPTSSSAVSYLWDNAATLSNPTIANPKASPSVTTEYVVIVTDINGCMNTDTVNVNVDPIPDADFIAEEICFGNITAFTDQSVITTGSITSWQWDFGDGMGSSNLQNPGYQYSAPGTYNVSLTVGSSNGCSASITKEVQINPLPSMNISADVEICVGETVEIGDAANLPASYTYNWFPADGIDDPTSANPKASPENTTKYYLIVTDVNTNCFIEDSILVTVHPLPNIIAKPDTSICVNGIVQLMASGADSYSWDPTQWLDDPTIANPVASPLKNIEYIVTGTDVNGCINTDTVVIDVFNVDLEDVKLCYGDSVQIFPEIQGDTNGITYDWRPLVSMNTSEPANPWIMPLVDTKYYLTIKDNSGCMDIDSLNAIVMPSPTADFEFELSPRCSFVVLELENLSSTGREYKWFLNDNLVSSGFDPTFDINPSGNDTLKLVVINDGCADTIAKAIPKQSLKEMLQIVQENVFTPNGDGINDVFKIGLEGEFMYCSRLTIYNRWGAKVYDSEIVNQGWDGRNMHGEPSANGTYFYLLDIDGEMIRGSVYLSR